MEMRAWSLGCLLLAFVAGCGGAIRVQGTVTLDGQPVSDGNISFAPVDGAGPSFGAAIKEGQFQVPGDATVTAGAKLVRIRGSIKTGKQIPAGPPHPPDKMTDEVRYYPAVGAKEEVLKADVSAGKVNDLPFELKTGKAGR
jgi:hypothetical protein